MTPPFAEELGIQMGCAAERDRLPPQNFVEEAVRPPPLYFETEERAFQGVCCVCYKKGCLGRCPNPECGLLMHHTCVEPLPNGDQQCPICKVERKCAEAGSSEKSPELDSGVEFPYWHEAEIGAPAGRRRASSKHSAAGPHAEMRGHGLRRRKQSSTDMRR